MYGREYANHLKVLTESFYQMNDNYQKKISNNNKANVLNTFKKYYIHFFGIPEVGFQIRSIYFHKFLNIIKLSNPLKILDAGSGIGAYTFRLAKYFPDSNITGVDIDKKKIKSSIKIKNELKLSNLRFINSDIAQLSPKNKYDLVVIIDVLEHVNHYQKILKKFKNILSKNGYIYIHVPQPNQKRIFSSLKDWHHDDHVVEGITKNELNKTLKMLGFKVILCQETFGFFGKLSWEINHILLSKNVALAGLIFPFLYPLIYVDLFTKNKKGLCVACLAQKK